MNNHLSTAAFSVLFLTEGASVTKIPDGEAALCLPVGDGEQYAGFTFPAMKGSFSPSYDHITFRRAAAEIIGGAIVMNAQKRLN